VRKQCCIEARSYKNDRGKKEQERENILSVNVRKEGRKYNYKSDDVMKKVWESNAIERRKGDTREGQRMGRKYYFHHSDGP
jgi:hypothetical protein